MSLTALLGVWIVLGHLLVLGEETEVEAAKEMDLRGHWVRKRRDDGIRPLRSDMPTEVGTESPAQR